MRVMWEQRDLVINDGVFFNMNESRLLTCRKEITHFIYTKGAKMRHNLFNKSFLVPLFPVFVSLPFSRYIREEKIEHEIIGKCFTVKFSSFFSFPQSSHCFGGNTEIRKKFFVAVTLKNFVIYQPSKLPRSGKSLTRWHAFT